MYKGYPVVTRTNGLIISRIYLDAGKVVECVQTDPNAPEKEVLPEPKKSGNAGQTGDWDSAREMRRTDKYQDWYEALYLGM